MDTMELLEDPNEELVASVASSKFHNKETRKFSYKCFIIQFQNFKSSLNNVYTNFFDFRSLYLYFFFESF